MNALTLFRFATGFALVCSTAAIAQESDSIAVAQRLAHAQTVINQDTQRLAQLARATAVAESVTAYVGVSAGVAAPGLVSTNPLGLAAMAGARWGIVEWAQREGTPVEETQRTLRLNSAFWGGVSVSNLLVALSATNPVAIVVGLFAGAAIFTSSEVSSPKLIASAQEDLPFAPMGEVVLVSAD